MTATVLVLVIPALLAGIASALMTAPALSAWLVRRRAASLPSELVARLLEEWLAELGHLESRGRQLLFAGRLFSMTRKALIDATSIDDAIEGRNGAVVVSLDQLHIQPDSREHGLATAIDVALLAVPLWVAWLTAPTLVTFLLSGVVWVALWLVVVQIWSVRLWHATPGQRFSGIRIVTFDGSPLGWRHILRRARLVGLAVVVGMPTAVVIGFPSDAPVGEVVFIFILFMSWYSRNKPKPRGRLSGYLSSGTTTIMSIPTVVGVPGKGPSRSTSLTR